MLNYNQSSIYKLFCKDLNITEIYIGSTTNFIRRRLEHRKNSNSNGNKDKSAMRLYKFIKANGFWGNWEMVLLETYNCDNKIELQTRERYWIEELKPKLNSQIPGRTQKEYRTENKDKIALISKEYRTKNKDKIAIRDRNYRKNNKTKIDILTKEYNKKNKDKISLRKKLKYNKNKGKIKIIKCGCGSSYKGFCKSKINNHEKSEKHQKWLSTIVYIIIED
jgi:hypothetical protein